ncbi:hypothetical protein [Ruminococcus flavefaciens]|uniref:hypothetical protein n=1 Tax=Ruminococcus flavefaciens TaxID=1265 RepID=UPI0026EB260A|nr:hypothetical protein [Ruminococcus flavefaciens]
MAKKKSITRISDKKRGRPKIRFSFWGLIAIFMLSFATCFILYMVAANFNENFFSDEFENVVVEDKTSADTDSVNTSGTPDTEQTGAQSSSALTNPIAQSQPKDASYLGSCCLVTDNTLIDMGKYTGLTDIIGSGELGAANCNTYTMESSYGTKTAYEILQTKKPEKVYIMLGDDIGTSSVDDMISNYTEFVKNVRGYLTDADIYIMQLPPAGEGSTIDNGAINEFNTKLLTIANTNNVYCIDTNTALKGVDGKISKEFIDTETGALTEKAYKTIADYVLCHTV